ncbi:MAG TPA: tetraacyldisaccharide 4'-kinase [Gammaproteobacteria bacterium]
MKAWLEGALNSLWYGRNPLAWVLWPLALVYRGVMAGRRFAYARGWLRTVKLPVPVIVIGNLTVGGTGKTPLVIWLARALTERGMAVGIVTRGYRGRAEQWPQRVQPDSDPRLVGDEAVLLARRTGCPVVAGPDRVAAARQLLDEHRVDVLLADDGLQHLALGRDMEIAVVDGRRGLGNGLCLPAGPLREPRSRLRGVDAIVVNGGEWGHAGVFRAELEAQEAVRVGGQERRPLAAWSGREVHAAAGIGHPRRFFALLEDAGLEVTPHALGDHADVTPERLAFTPRLPVLVTEKDAVKLSDTGELEVWSVPVELRFAAGHAERLLALVLRILRGSES